MAASLTPNAIIALNSGEVDLHPLVQVLDVRQIGTGQSVQERYRLVLSDGNYVQQAMLATQLNDLVKSGEVQKGSIVKLVEYICNTVQQRKIVIVLNMEVVASVSGIIGDPKQVIINDQTLNAATTAGGVQQQQRPTMQVPAVAPQPQQQQRPTMQAPAVAPQPQQQLQAYGSMANGGYKPSQGAGVQQMNGMYAKEGAASHTSPASKPAQPVGYQGHGYSPLGGNAQAASGVGAHSNLQASSYGRPVVAPSSYQPAPLYSNRGPVAKNEAPARIVPIAALNPYQGRWTIKARVTSKGELRRFHNAKGEGKVFSFDLLDAEGGEIRVTCFNTVADQFYERIDLGSVYMISKGSLKPAQRSFNRLKSDWEIFLENSSTVEQCSDEDGSIPQQQFDFRPISEIENMEGNAMVDIVGVVVIINPSTTIMRKTGTEVQKRSLQLCDTSGCSVELTMWGVFCNSEGQHLQDLCDSGHFPVLAVKGGRVSDFGGKSVGTVSNSQLLINPNLPQALEVTEWFEQVGKNTSPQSISKEGGSGPRIDMRKTVLQIKDERLGRSDKPDWIALRATISFIKTDNFCYTACPLPVSDRQCNKKVTNNGDGTWRCDRCDKAVAECDYRYLLSVQVQDHTGATWVTAFQEAGEEIIGVSAKELYMWKQDESPKYGELIQKLLFSQYLFKLKVKEENYNDELRVKCTAVKSEKLDYAAESKILIDMIGKVSRGEPISGPASTLSGITKSGYHNTYGGSTFGASVQLGPPGGGTYGGNASFAPTAFGGGYVNGASNNHTSGSCFKCGGGHYAKDCPNERAMGQNIGNFGGGFHSGGSIESTSACFKCGQGGHWARDCLGQGAGGGSGRESSYGGNAGYG